MSMPDALRRSFVPAAGLIVLAAIATAAGYLSPGDSNGAAPAAATTVASEEGAVRGVVQAISGDSLTLSTSSGLVTLRLAPSLRVEALRTATLGQARQGDWLNAGAISHNQTLFAIIGLVIIPAEELQ